MKRIFLALCCVLALLLAGCTTINQTNSFTELPTPLATETPVVTGAPEIMVTPGITVTPAEPGTPTLPPMVQLDVRPTQAPGDTTLPQDMPTETPGSSPNGFNG